MRISVIGWYGKGNCGDECYKTALPQIFPGHEWTFDGSSGDCYILGGGNVVKEPFIQVANRPGKKIAFSVSVTREDPIHHLHKFDQVFVRSQWSESYLKSEGIPAIYVPDAAFILEPNKQNGVKLLKRLFEGKDLYERKVMVVMNSFLIGREGWSASNHQTFNHICWTLGKVMDDTMASFIFVPFSTKDPWDDRVFNSYLANRCKWWKKNAVCWETLTPQDTLDLTSSVDAVISMRLHSSIFACLCEKPFIDITHHDKNLRFLESIYRGEWSHPYWSFDGPKFKERLDQHLMCQDNGLASVVSENKLALTGIKKHVRFL